MTTNTPGRGGGGRRRRAVPVDRRWLLPASSAAVAGSIVVVWVLPGHPLWPLGVAALAFVAVVATGVARIGSGIFAPVVLRGPAGGGRLSLTFDDGPDPRHTLAIAERLARSGHRATFFVVGERALRHPELLRQLDAAGHEIGVHSFDHSLRSSAPSMRWLRDDFARAAAAVTQAIGRRPRLYRPPVGLLNPRIAREARRGGWTIVGWSARARDGVRTSPAAVLQRLGGGLRDGAIVLLHDRVAGGDPAVVTALPGLIDALAARELRSVPLSELLGEPAYREPAVARADGDDGAAPA